MISKKQLLFATSTIAIPFLMVGIASASTSSTLGFKHGRGKMLGKIGLAPGHLKWNKMGMSSSTPMIGGKVASVNGASFTLTVQPFRHFSSTTPVANKTYTVNTTGATTFTKDGVAAALSDVTVGENIFAVGVVDNNALTVAATKVGINTKMPMMGKGHGKRGHGK